LDGFGGAATGIEVSFVGEDSGWEGIGVADE
jgi:hypothetical protein